MNLLSAGAFWPIRDGLPVNYPTLDHDADCEVAIVGAGISGALVAWRLAEAGIATIVLDRRDVAHGSTAGSTSLLQYELDEPLHRLERRYGQAPARQAYRCCRDAIDGLAQLVARLNIDCGFRRRASLLVACNRSHLPRLRREFTARVAAGFPVEWWPRSRLARASTLPYPAGILSQEAAEVDGYLLAHGLLSAARERGAAVYDRTAVKRIRMHRSGVELSAGRNRRVRARHLVVATGYEAERMLPRRVTEWRSTYALVTEPVSGFSGWPGKRCLIWESCDPYLYLRTTADQRVIMGGGDEPFLSAAARDRLLTAKTALLHHRLRRLFPRIPSEVAYAWAGTFARTVDGLPLIGPHPAAPHTWFALGFGGNGITFSFIAAAMIRDFVCGRTPADADLFGFARLVR
ncbi:MAG TPA: FAD-dependent oxidoreductase [Opitutus sp.]|nr:FAD-dependent oxidoreductase [Opitutus sp.]